MKWVLSVVVLDGGGAWGGYSPPNAEVCSHNSPPKINDAPYIKRLSSLSYS